MLMTNHLHASKHFVAVFYLSINAMGIMTATAHVMTFFKEQSALTLAGAVCLSDQW